MDSAVKFVDVYKEYPFYQHITAGFKSFIFDLPRNIKTFKKTRFDVLKAVSFDIKKGETFGIIGRNGSGKSTILSLMAGVIKQDQGVVQTFGKISSLLELGSGFHPDLSGIENIILNGILMGNTRQDMLEKVDEIVTFSELGDFIYQPLRTYSSGMHVRLGFSVAVHINPEILLVDEALAVGDMGFQEKCLKKMGEFRTSGATIILVSHDMMSIAKLCERVAWIDSGSIMAIGKPKEVIMKYMDHFNLQTTGLFLKEGQNTDRENIQSATAAPSAPRGSGDFLHAEAQPTSLVPVNVEHSEVPPISSSWWEYPVVLQECETRITGRTDLNFYDFLKDAYNIQGLEKGLSICNRLKGIENNFIAYNTCKSFDIIDDENQIEGLLEGTSKFKENNYDLFLCVDVLNRIKNPDLFLASLDRALKHKGFIIAMEYVGPVNFRYSDKEIEVADMIFKSLNDGNDGIDATASCCTSGKMTGAISSQDVIPMLEKYFDMLTIRYFGGPFYDLLLNKALCKFNPGDKKDSALIKAIIQFDQILINEGIFEKSYSMIIATKKGIHVL